MRTRGLKSVPVSVDCTQTKCSTFAELIDLLQGGKNDFDVDHFHVVELISLDGDEGVGKRVQMLVDGHIRVFEERVTHLNLTIREGGRVEDAAWSDDAQQTQGDPLKDDPRGYYRLVAHECHPR